MYLQYSGHSFQTGICITVTCTDTITAIARTFITAQRSSTIHMYTTTTVITADQVQVTTGARQAERLQYADWKARATVQADPPE